MNEQKDLVSDIIRVLTSQQSGMMSGHGDKEVDFSLAQQL